MIIPFDLSTMPRAALEVAGAIAFDKRPILPGFYCVLESAITAELHRRSQGTGDPEPLAWPDLPLAETIAVGSQAACFQVAAIKAAGGNLPPGADTWQAVAQLLTAIVTELAVREVALAASVDG